MARRVKPGDKFNVTAAEYNRLLAAADAIARDRLAGGAGNRTHVRDAATVRVHYQSATTVPIGGIVGFNAPLGDPDVGPAELARFVRDATIQSVEPDADEHVGRFGVAIEPIAVDKVGRVVFAGVVAARVNVQATWHQYADVANAGGTTLQSKPNGSAQILWRRSPNQTGMQWAVVRVGKPVDPAYFVKVPGLGINARQALTTGPASCQLFQLNATGELEPIESDNLPVFVVVRNPSTQPIAGPLPGAADEYLSVTFDGKQWVLDPPSQTVLGRPKKRIRSKSWGYCAELRWNGNRWIPTGRSVYVYNICDMALLTTQHVMCQFREDALAYLAVSSRCCDESSSSSSSSSSYESSSTSSSSSSLSSSFSSSPSSSSHSSSVSSSSNSSVSSSSTSPSSSDSSESQSSQSPSSTSPSVSSGSASSASDSPSASQSQSTSASASESKSESGSTSRSSSQSNSESTSEPSDSTSSESEEPSDSTPSQSDKSTAIVPASWSPGGYTALFTEEAPEVLFHDTLLVKMSGRVATVAIDPRFVEVCEPGTIVVSGAVPDEPVLVGAKAIGDAVQIKLDVDCDDLQVVVTLTAIRRGFAAKRFPDRSHAQFIANERFLQSAYPGAGQ
jgi:hypothetical protein